MKKQQLLFVLTLLLGSVSWLQMGCDKNETDNDLHPPNDLPYVDLEKIPYPNLSDYQFFVGDLNKIDLNDGIVPYDLNGSLFANYAYKKRFLYLPTGTTATYKAEGVLDFPVGTVIIKHFYYPKDLRDSTKGNFHIETRLLVRHASEWLAYSYLWNETQTEATFSVIGKQIPVSWIDENGIEQHINYVIPNKNQCKECHSSNNQLVPLGPQAMQLNKTYTFDNSQDNQLLRWKNMAILSDLPDISSVPHIPNPFDTSADINLRARSYMDVNCAGCHNPLGAANNSGLDLSLSQTDPVAYGVCKSPVAAGGGSGTLNYDIVPKHPERSIVIYRMGSLQTDVAMPELLRTTVDTAGLRLLSEWIAAMPPGPCE